MFGGFGDSLPTTIIPYNPLNNNFFVMLFDPINTSGSFDSERPPNCDLNSVRLHPLCYILPIFWTGSSYNRLAATNRVDTTCLANPLTRRWLNQKDYFYKEMPCYEKDSTTTKIRKAETEKLRHSSWRKFTCFLNFCSFCSCFSRFLTVIYFLLAGVLEKILYGD